MLRGFVTYPFLPAVVFCFCLPAQPFASPAAPAAAQTAAPQDPLGRATPRSAVLGFLNAARKKDFGAAALYLDTRLRGKAAAVLAEQLYVILDRRLPPRLTRLSDQPEGSLHYPAQPDRDLVGVIEGADGRVEIILDREDRGKLGRVWLFSNKTLESIPDLYAEMGTIPLAGMEVLEWLALLLALPTGYYATVLLSRALSPAVGHLRRRWRRKPELANPVLLPGPIRLLGLAAMLRFTLAKVSLPLLTRQAWSSITVVITIAGFVWLAMRLLEWSEHAVLGRFARGSLLGFTPLLRFARRAFDVLFVFVGFIVVLRYFGVNTTAAIAGLGVGGIAIALAAQKTLENVIGGLSLIFDGTVALGDFLGVSGTQGTVMNIGLRSTRIRTNDRTVVSVPNGQIANASLENFSARDKFWFHHMLGLHCETTAAQIRLVLEALNRLLAHHPRVEDDSIRVRFVRFGASSLDLEIVSYLFAHDWNHFLEMQEELLLRIMGIIQSAGARIALPAQNLYLATGNNGGAENIRLEPEPSYQEPTMPK